MLAKPKVLHFIFLHLVSLHGCISLNTFSSVMYWFAVYLIRDYALFLYLNCQTNQIIASCFHVRFSTRKVHIDELGSEPSCVWEILESNCFSFPIQSEIFLSNQVSIFKMIMKSANHYFKLFVSTSFLFMDWKASVLLKDSSELTHVDVIVNWNSIYVLESYFVHEYSNAHKLLLK